MEDSGTLPTFIASCLKSAYDFLHSDVSNLKCRLYCQFDASEIDRGFDYYLSRTGIVSVLFNSGQELVRSGNVWRYREKSRPHARR